MRSSIYIYFIDLTAGVLSFKSFLKPLNFYRLKWERKQLKKIQFL